MQLARNAREPSRSGCGASGCLRRLIKVTGQGRFGPLITPQSDERRRPLADGLQSGAREFADGRRFFGFFDGRLRLASLRGRAVLDLGCGYGGRTAFYALRGEPELVEGLEVEHDKVARCEAFARQKQARRAHFTVGRAETLPFEDDIEWSSSRRRASGPSGARCCRYSTA